MYSDTQPGALTVIFFYFVELLKKFNGEVLTFIIIYWHVYVYVCWPNFIIEEMLFRHKETQYVKIASDTSDYSMTVNYWGVICYLLASVLFHRKGNYFSCFFTEPSKVSINLQIANITLENIGTGVKKSELVYYDVKLITQKNFSTIEKKILC